MYKQNRMAGFNTGKLDKWSSYKSSIKLEDRKNIQPSTKFNNFSHWEINNNITNSFVLQHTKRKQNNVTPTRQSAKGVFDVDHYLMRRRHAESKEEKQNESQKYSKATKKVADILQNKWKTQSAESIFGRNRVPKESIRDSKQESRVQEFYDTPGDYIDQKSTSDLSSSKHTRHKRSYLESLASAYRQKFRSDTPNLPSSGLSELKESSKFQDEKSKVAASKNIQLAQGLNLLLRSWREGMPLVLNHLKRAFSTSDKESSSQEVSWALDSFRNTISVKKSRSSVKEEQLNDTSAALSKLLSENLVLMETLQETIENGLIRLQHLPQEESKVLEIFGHKHKMHSSPYETSP